jgi:hypothetical protein
MRLRIQLQRNGNTSNDVDWAIAQYVGQLHALVVDALNAQPQRPSQVTRRTK